MANGLPAFLLQVVVTDSNKWLDFIYDVTTYAVQIPTKTYGDMRAVCAALATVMDTACVAGAPFSVTALTSGKIYFAPDTPDTFSLLWKNGTHGAGNGDDHCGHLLGYSDAADDTGSTSYTGDYQHQYGWYSEHGPTFDSRNRPRRIGPATFVSISSRATRTTFATHYPRRVDLAWISKEKFYSAFAANNEDFETWWLEAASGTPFKYYSSTDTWEYEGLYVLTQSEDEDLLDQVSRLEPGAEYYSLTLRMIKQA